MKKYLLVVPHQDDEINLVGGLLKQFSQLDVERYLIFTTNGDFCLDNLKRRTADTQKSLKLFQFKQVIYLGYGDSLYGKHLYHTKEQEILTSRAGRSETYGPAPFVDYRFEKSGYHSKYTRDDYKQDLKDVILDILPDVVFYVDCDEHPDHRCASLICDEIFKELYVEKGFMPILLKRFAYCGAWFGELDYFTNPLLPTSLHGFHEDNDENNSFPYLWQERIRFQNDAELLSMDFRRSLLYKSLKYYGTEDAIERFEGLANTDTVFWYRDVDNVALKATITASSGNPEGLNDFKLLDYEDVAQIDSRVTGLSGFWQPEARDKTPRIYLDLGDTQEIKEIRLHQGAPYLGKIRQIRVRFDQGEMQEYSLSEDYVNSLSLLGTYTRSVEIELVDFDFNCVIREIEIFNHSSSFPTDAVGLQMFREKDYWVSAFKCSFSKLLFFVQMKIRWLGKKTIFRRKSAFD